MVHPSLPAGFDFTDPEIYAERLPVEELKELRKTAPIWWQEQPDGVGGFNDGGYWVVTKHKDVKEVSLRSDVFSSWENTAIPRFQDDITREAIELQRYVMLNMDAPHHTRLRKIISRGFTPRAIGRLRDELNERAQEHRQGCRGAVAPATSSSRCRVSCRCKPLLVCSVCRSRTAASSLTGPTK
ncbi:putative cytochrome P450 [Mycobacteroides abscessus subsp. bolletii BD]|nr:putative cytochrome P450 [Mycobacteroides abscessus subsp. bolletii BD]